MQRRTFIERALLASTVSLLPACRPSVNKAEVLRALVEQVVVRNTRAIADHSRRLESEIARLADAPAISALQAAREQWQRTLLSWKRADAFRNGPIADTNCLLRALFWPVRTAAIDELLQGAQALDEVSISAVGVDRRGLFALEYLLYSGREPDQRIVDGFSGADGERRSRLARSLAGNISFYADNTARTLGNGKAYGDEFASGGQDSLNRLVGQLVHTVEVLCADRLARVASLARGGRLVPSEVEGNLSQTSQKIALAYARAAEELYLGVDRGLSALVKAQSSATDDSLRAAFKQAIAAVSELGLPLEEVAKRDLAALDAATTSVKRLERALKTELVSTLGVTSTFSSVDGD